MLKIYLDWNSINNIQTRHPKLYELIKEYGHLFIFPYSNAHIRDLMVSKDENNPFYQRDIATLTEICGKHLLQFEDENNWTSPLFCLPEDYIDLIGTPLEIIQKTDWFPQQIFQQFKENVRKSFPDSVQKRIQGANPEEVFKIINEGLKSINSELTIEELSLSQVNSIRNMMNEEARFKSLCLALDMCGFRPEDKDKSFTNIDADASHIFYASKCDMLVSGDRKMRGKAEAMFSKYNVVTKVLTPKQFEDLILEEVNKEYSLQNLLSSIRQYGHPHEEEDGAHYKLMESPVFGLFNACFLVDEHFGCSGEPKSALFVYCFNNTPYLYYTELTRFFDLIKSFLSEKMKNVFQKEYVNEICSRDKRRAMDARFFFECPDLNLSFAFYGDPISPVPCPMMQVRFA